MNDRMPEVRTSVKRGLPYGKRDLLYTQNRPINDRMPEVRTSVNRDLRIQGKRHLFPHEQVSFDTYLRIPAVC